MKDDQLGSFIQSKLNLNKPIDIVPFDSVAIESEINTASKASQQLTKQSNLQYHKLYLSAPKDQIKLISRLNQNTNSQLTIKRNFSPFGKYLESEGNELGIDNTKAQIRMKIVLENNRLRGSIQILKRDLDHYRSNQLKITEVLRETKEKLTENKHRLKEKSKRITTLTDSIISLKAEKAALSEKINHLNSYSEWQERQIRELKRQLACKNQNIEEAAALRQKIQKLQLLIRSYQSEIRDEDNKESQKSIDRTPKYFSSHTISDKSPFSWKEMEMNDLDGIKFRNIEDEQIQQINEINNALKNKLIDAEQQLDCIRNQNISLQRNLANFKVDRFNTQGSLRNQLGIIMTKYSQMQQRLKEKDQSIAIWERDMKQLRQQVSSNSNISFAKQQKLKTQITEITSIITQREQQNDKLVQSSNQREQQFKRQLQEIQLFIQSKDEENKVIIRDYEEKNKQLTQSLTDREQKMYELYNKIEQLENHRLEIQEKFNEADHFLTERKNYQHMITKLEDSIEYYKKLPQDNIKYFEEELQKAYEEIRSLKEEKVRNYDEMECSVREIHQLKLEIREMYRQKNDSLSSRSERSRAINEHNEYEENILTSQTSAIKQPSRQNKSSRVIIEEEEEEKSENLNSLNPIQDQEELSFATEKFNEVLTEKNGIIQKMQEEINILTLKYSTLLDQGKKHTMSVIEASFLLQKQIQDSKKMELQAKILEGELSEAKDQLKTVIEKYQLSQKTIHDVTTERNRLIEKNNELKHEMESSQRDRLQYLKQVHCLQQNMESERANNKSLLGDIQLLTAQNTKILSALHVLETDRKQAFQNMKQSQKAIAEFQNFEKTTKLQIYEKVAILQKIINDQKDQIDKINNQRHQSIAEKQHLIISLKDTEIEMGGLTQRISQLQEYKEQSTAERQQMARSASNEKQQNARLNAIISQLGQQIGKLRLENGNYKMENGQFRSRFSSQDKIMKDISNNIVNLKQSMNFSKSEENILRESANREQQSLSLKFEDLYYDNLKMEISQIQSRHNNIVEEYQQKIKDLQSKTEDRNQQNISLQGQIARQSREIGQMTQKLNILSRQSQEKGKELIQSQQQWQKQSAKLNEDLEKSKLLMRQHEDQYQMKINKLSKQLSNHKHLLDQSQNQNNFKLEQSNRSISEVKTELRTLQQNIDQKDLQIKQQNDAISNFKKHIDQLKLTIEEQRNNWQTKDASYGQQIYQLGQQNLKISAENNNLAKSLQKQEQQHEKLRLESHQLNKSNEQLRNDREKICSERTKLQETVKDCKVRILQVEEKLLKQISEKDRVLQLKNQQQSAKQQIRQRITSLEQEVKMSSLKLIQQKDSLDENEKVKKDRDEALQKVKQFSQNQKNIHKQYQAKIEKICCDEREHLLQVERKYNKQIESLTEELAKLQKEKHKQRKESENDRGELTDKIIQLNQQNNQLQEVIENLRNSAIQKSNELQEGRDLIYKLQQKIQQLNAKLLEYSGSISLPAGQQKINQAYEFIDKLQEINKQAQIKHDALQEELRLKIREIRQLNQKLDKIRNNSSSGDSFVSRSRIFDEKSHLMHAQLEQTKHKLEWAEAYIIQLEDQCHLASQSVGDKNQASLNNVKKRNVEQLQNENENLRIQIEQCQAYINQLEQQVNQISLARSKRSVRSKSIRKEPSERSFRGEESAKHKHSQIYSMDKINLLIDFIETYVRDNHSRNKEEQIKARLSEPNLEELLSTIIYRLEKESLIYKDKEHAIDQLHEENQHLEEQLKDSQENYDFVVKKCSLYQGFQKKYEESEKDFSDLLTGKMKIEADLAEARSYIEELENKLERQYASQSKHHSKANKAGKGSLQILEEQNQSSDSEDADLNKDYVSRSKAERSKPSENECSMQFLKKCLGCIASIEGEVSQIQGQLEDKARLLSKALGSNVNKEQLINKLQTIESKISTNDREMRLHRDTNELELAYLIKDLLKYRHEHDQYGLQNQNRKKIAEYLSLLEQQLLKNSKYYEQEGKSQDSRKIDNSPPKSKTNLQEIKEDANEDKGSSIMNPRNPVLQSFSNSEGVTESFDVNELKVNYNDAMKELHMTHDELVTKEETIKVMQQRYSIIQQETFAILDEIRVYFQQNQYLFQQIEKVKKYMSRYLQDQSLNHSKDKEFQRLNQQKCNNILIDSGKKNICAEKQKKKENPLEMVIKMDELELEDLAETVPNQVLKQLHKKVSKIIDQRIDDCMEFLNSQKSLIADILKIKNNQNELEMTMNKLASRLTKQQITDIIANSHNRTEANKALAKILLQDDSCSQASDEQDFSPNGEKIQEIRNNVYHQPTELSLSLHDQLIDILGAPSRQQFYSVIERFYLTLKQFEDRYRMQISQLEQKSQKHSVRMKRLLQDPLQMEGMMELEGLINQKIRTNSCLVQDSKYPK